MAKEEQVTKVWIVPGCIVCDACETAAPDVFEVKEDTCVVRPEAQDPEFTMPRSQAIKDAAEECPVDVIKFETASVAVEEKKEKARPAAVPAAKKPEKAAAAPKEAARPAAEKKAPAKTEREPAGAKVAARKEESPDDDTIAALLRAATSRGGIAVISKKQRGVPESLEALKRQDPRKLPPDARQAKVREAARKARKSPDKERRAFLSRTALGVGWVAFGFGTGVSAGPAFYRFMMPNVLEEPDPRVRVGRLQRYRELQPGAVVEDFKPEGLYIIRDGDRIAALTIICTHLGCIPNWLANDRKFKCPCHGSGFKPDGINFEGPAPRPLERFRIYIEDGIVVVDKSAKYQYELGQWDLPGSYLEV